MYSFPTYAFCCCKDNKVISANFRFSARYFRKRNFCSKIYILFWGGGNCPYFPYASYRLICTYHLSLTVYVFDLYYKTHSTDIPPTVDRYSTHNQWSTYRPSVGCYIGRLSADISVDMSTITRPIYIGQYIDRYILVDISTDSRPIRRSTYQPIIDRYVDQYIGRESVNMSTDTSGCTKYT